MLAFTPSTPLPLRRSPPLASRRPSPSPDSAPKPTASAAMPPPPPTPTGLVPKRETGVAAFTAARPTADGRGIVVAILDTGVDPGARGLRHTPGGAPKVIDCIDCTGGGDVALVPAAAVDGVVAGAAGRRLVLGGVADMNPAHPGGYFVGVKAAYSLLPAALVARMKRERKAEFEERHREVGNGARKALEEARKALEAAVKEAKAQAKVVVDEAEARVKALVEARKSADLGPVYDCVVFWDGAVWRAVVDTDGEGDIGKGQVMEDYRINCAYGTFMGLVNYTVNVFDDGRTLSICVDSGAHGTHVAGMVSSYYEGERHMDGGAPGTRIVSLKIGDTRLASMETHQGLNRALAYLLAHSKAPGDEKTAADDGIVVDIANMSFGEPTHKPDSGRFISLANQLVREHNVLFFCSAGNSGPALTSVSAPGGTTDCLIGVGAYVTPNMLIDGYSLLEDDIHTSLSDAEAAFTAAEAAKPVKVEASGEAPALGEGGNAVIDRSPVGGMPYTWCSRGPAPDGSIGVSLCAPGAAIASVPQYLLSRKKLMNGTSMASPCATAACAVLLSGLKQAKIPYTSDSVRRALENSARPLGIPYLSGKDAKGKIGTSSFGHKYSDDLIFAGGHGSINIGLANSMLEKANAIAVSSPFVAAVASSGNGESKHISSLAPAKVCTRDESERPRPVLSWRYRASVETIAPLAARKNVAATAGGGNSGATRGVYLRGKEETSVIQRMSVKLEALRDDEKKLDSNKLAQAAMETTVELSASENWVSVPANILLYASGRNFPISVDPTGLSPGKVHYAEISGFVEGVPGGGKESLRCRVFSLPVTVIVPEATLPGVSQVEQVKDFSLCSGQVKRSFYTPPLGATYGILKIAVDGPERSAANYLSDAASDVTSIHSSEARRLSAAPARAAGLPGLSNGDAERGDMLDSSSPSALSGESRLLDVHIVQVLPRQPSKHTETRQIVSLVPGATKEVLFTVVGGVTVEIALGHRWSSMGTSHFRAVDVMFCGLKPDRSSLHMQPGACCFPRLSVVNALPGGATSAPGNHGNAHTISTFHPKASLSAVHRPIPPFYSEISLLSADRDGLPRNTILSQLVLEYSFVVEEDLSTVQVTFPGLNGRVYDGLVEGGPFVTLHDSNKRLLVCSDIYPAQKGLKKGTYYARAFIRHDRVAVLEKLKDVRAVVVYKLGSELTLDCFDTAQGAALGGEISTGVKSTTSKGWKGLLEPGERLSLFFGCPKASAIPKWVTAGDTFYGEYSVDAAVFSGAADEKQSSRIPKYELSMPVPVPLQTGVKTSMSQKLSTHSKSETVQCEKGCIDESQAPAPAASVADGAWEKEATDQFATKALRGYLKEKKGADFDRMLRLIESSRVDDVEILILKLQRLDSGTKLGKECSQDELQQMREVIAVADTLISNLDSNAIAAYFGLRNVETEKTEERKKFESKRASLITALFRKARALLCIQMSTKPSEGEQEYEQAFIELQQWHKMDVKSTISSELGERLGEEGALGAVGAEDFALLSIHRHMVRDCPALALKATDSYLASSHVAVATPRSFAELRVEIFKKLDWAHIVDYEERSIAIRYPAGLESI